ncbi:MlaD family protein [Pseudaquidulcibacter saccharophilus]|uniref:MlaD family protein n=1 Tax=Pseudaquidulcibacter saccharophilus TaxID=2831900 RepID=UPI001EFF5579|nr:MlaD family protein [Pseudaquidulcibacter saccharophilus]
METKANFVLIGAFTILSLVLAAIFTVWIANTGFDQQYGEYDVSFRGPVRGLEIGSEVRFNGIKVGEVSKLSLDKTNPSNVIARIRITSETPVKTDSVAQLEPSGITGLSYIQILAGGENSPPLVRLKGQERPLIASRPGQLDRFLEGGEGVLDNALETVVRLNRLLNDKNLKSFSETLKNLDTSTARLAGNGQLLDSATQAARSIDQAGQEVKVLAKSMQAVPQMANTYNELGKNLTTQTGTLLNNSNDLVVNLNNLSKSTDKTIQRADSALVEINASAKNIHKSTENLDAAVNNFNAATISVDKFFTMGTYDTLPSMNAAAQSVKSASDNLNRTLDEVSDSPNGFLSKAPSNSVKWKK